MLYLCFVHSKESNPKLYGIFLEYMETMYPEMKLNAAYDEIVYGNDTPFGCAEIHTRKNNKHIMDFMFYYNCHIPKSLAGMFGEDNYLVFVFDYLQDKFPEYRIKDVE